MSGTNETAQYYLEYYYSYYVSINSNNYCTVDLHVIRAMITKPYLCNDRLLGIFRLHVGIGELLIL